MTDPTSRGVDYSTARPDPAALYEHGYRFALRYVGLGGAAKQLTGSELHRLRAAGLGVGLLCEGTEGWVLGGRAAGALAAAACKRDVLALGLGWPRCVYYACDIDVSADQAGYVLACLAGAVTVHGHNNIGLYGPGWLVERALSVYACRYGMVAAGWRHGWVHERAQLVQGQQLVMGGQLVDPVAAYGTDLGLVRPPAPPRPQEEQDMRLVARTGDYATFATDGKVRWGVHDNTALSAYRAAGFPYAVVSEDQYATLSTLIPPAGQDMAPPTLAGAEGDAPL